MEDKNINNNNNCCGEHNASLGSLELGCGKGYNFLFSPRIFFSLFLEGERETERDTETERERERERERNINVTETSIGCLLSAPWLEIKPAT